jgi:hypothetical protein
MTAGGALSESQYTDYLFFILGEGVGGYTDVSWKASKLLIFSKGAHFCC